MKRRKYLNLRCVVSFAAGLTLLGVINSAVSPAVADPSDPIGDQAIKYPVDLKDLPGAEVWNVKGDQKGDGCTFSGEGQGSPGEVVVVAEVSYSSSMCAHEIAVARYNVSTLPSAVARALRLDRVEGGLGVPRSGRQARVTPLATYAHSARLWARIQDPINLTTTETGVRVQWNATSSSVGSYTTSHELNWLSASGWQKTSESTTRGRTSSTKVWGNTKGTFKNSSFCPFGTTYANHSRTWLEGRPSGKSSWAYEMNKSGGCSDLLHYYYIYLP